MTGEDRHQWLQGVPADWALESLAIVRVQVYRLPGRARSNATYIEAARAVIRTRLVLAGTNCLFSLRINPFLYEIFNGWVKLSRPGIDLVGTETLHFPSVDREEWKLE